MYMFYLNEGIDSGNRGLCQSSIEASLDLLEQHFHTGPSD